jgi:YbbR domain-containing protein
MKKIRKNKFFKAVISLFFAYLLWAVAVSESDPTSTNKYTNIVINYTGLNDSYVIENQIETVDVKLYGRIAQLNKVKKSDITATVDLSAINSEGVYTFEVVISGISDAITVSDISTKYVTLTVSKLESTTKTFTIDVKGNLPDGYYVLDHSADTDTVTLYGSASMLEKVASVKGEVNVSSNKYDFESLVTLYAYDENGNVLNNVTVAPSEVSVSTLIGTSKDVDVEILTSGTCAEGYELLSATSDTTQVKISGPVSAINQITNISTVPIDLTGVSSSFTAVALIDTPSGVTASPASVTVTVNIKSGDISKSLTYTSLQVRNQPSNLTCDLSSFSSLTITVVGAKDVIDALEASDITVYIDLSGLTAGTHTVSINYIKPDDVSITSSSADTVTVTLTE